MEDPGLPLPAWLLARAHLPGRLHRRRPLRLLRRQEPPPARAAHDQVLARGLIRAGSPLRRAETLSSQQEGASDLEGEQPPKMKLYSS